MDDVGGGGGEGVEEEGGVGVWVREVGEEGGEEGEEGGDVGGRGWG